MIGYMWPIAVALKLLLIFATGYSFAFANTFLRLILNLLLDIVYASAFDFARTLYALLISFYVRLVRFRKTYSTNLALLEAVDEIYSKLKYSFYGISITEWSDSSLARKAP